jgi:hypothetical protein
MSRYHLTVRFHNVESDDFDSDNYFYWVDTDKTIKAGDYIILKDDVNWDALKVVYVREVVDYNNSATIAAELPKAKTKALIGFADVSDYFNGKVKKRRAKEIKAELEKRFKEAEKMALYRKLAETDDTMKSLLSELDSLGVPEEEPEKAEEKF